MREDANLGRIVAGRFELQRKLGAGGYGTVYRAVQRTLDRPVALKLIRDPDERAEQRFEREARVVSSLRHPNTVRLLDFGRDGDELFMVLELVEGEDLRHLIAREAPLPPARVAHLAVQICESLAEAHARGIVHRDLKPENVMLDSVHGRSDFVRVLDFGIAKLLEGQPTTLTADGSVIGTPAYMPPEIWHGRSIDGRADLYALGVLCYELLAGRLPFDQRTATALMLAHVAEAPPTFSALPEPIDVPEPLAELVLRLLAKEPDERPATAEEVAELFARAVADQPTAPAPALAHSRTEALPLPGTAALPQETPPQQSTQLPVGELTGLEAPATRAPGLLVPGALALLVGAGGIFLWPEPGPSVEPDASPRAVAQQDVAPPPEDRPLPVDAKPTPPPPVDAAVARPDAAPRPVAKPRRPRVKKPVARPKRAATIELKSVPAGAAVYLNGARLGKTPLRVEAGSKATYMLRKQGFLEGFVRVVPGKRVGPVRLEPEPVPDL